MEFSTSYRALMMDLVDSTMNLGHFEEINRFNSMYSLMVRFPVNPKGCDIPTFTENRVTQFLNENAENENETTIVVPFSILVENTPYTGAETILRRLCYRTNESCLVKVTSIKGEEYYGNAGIILDKDFTPLLFSTTRISYNQSNGFCERSREYTIHLHPKVFTETNNPVCKSLARKGTAFYLSRGTNSTVYKVAIDDCSDYLIKPSFPDSEIPSDKGINDSLAANFDVLMSQIP